MNFEFRDKTIVVLMMIIYVAWNMNVLLVYFKKDNNFINTLTVHIRVCM